MRTGVLTWTKKTLPACSPLWHCHPINTSSSYLRSRLQVTKSGTTLSSSVTLLQSLGSILRCVCGGSDAEKTCKPILLSDCKVQNDICPCVAAPALMSVYPTSNTWNDCRYRSCGCRLSFVTERSIFTSRLRDVRPLL